MSELYSYRITLEQLPSSTSSDKTVTLTFETASNDDIIAIADKARRHIRDKDEAHAFAVGLKLFGQSLLNNREDQPFAALFPHFQAFMQGLKGR